MDKAEDIRYHFFHITPAGALSLSSESYNYPYRHSYDSFLNLALSVADYILKGVLHGDTKSTKKARA
jgi:hypothetical protein